MITKTRENSWRRRSVIPGTILGRYEANVIRLTLRAADTAREGVTITWMISAPRTCGGRRMSPIGGEEERSRSRCAPKSERHRHRADRLEQRTPRDLQTKQTRPRRPTPRDWSIDRHDGIGWRHSWRDYSTTVTYRHRKCFINRTVINYEINPRMESQNGISDEIGFVKFSWVDIYDRY